MDQTLLKHAQKTQNLASDPRLSVWVSASAGTGKTKVLTDRLLKLLLEGETPQRLLCLTFTKAAAAEMANRLHQRLSQWATLPKDCLKGEIQALTVSPPSESLCTQAQQLFTQVLETPGGLKIQTIHGFCQALLKRFPLEASVPPHFEVLEEQATLDLIHQALQDLLKKASSSPSLARALKVIASTFEEKAFTERMETLLLSHRKSLLGKVSSPPLEDSLLTEALNHLCCLENKIETRLMDAAELLAQGKKTDQERGQEMLVWLRTPAAARPKTMDAYVEAFLTQEGDPRKVLCTKDLSLRYPFLPVVLHEEACRLQKGKEDLKRLTVERLSQSFTFLGSVLLTYYEDLKRQKGVLDFEDLILKTEALLKNPGMGPWVLYKLDGGLDHILVDEAQDTSPSQWQIITALAEDFFAPSSSTGQTPKTLFVVGDTKQSIYSFQGADPQAFHGVKNHFQMRTQENSSSSSWRVLDLTTSFRSTEAVLTVVDHVFQDPDLRSALLLSDVSPSHQVSRKAQAGRVEIWPLEYPEDREETKSWELPLQEYKAFLDPEEKVASKLGENIAALLQTEVPLSSKGRPPLPSDILILVRRRGTFVPKLIRALKRKGIPVAGSDRLVLNDQLVVKDLLALGTFLLLPEDDLTLATVLKSPLFSLREEELYDLCIDRPGSLWMALVNSGKHLEVVACLKTLLNLQDQIRPFDLYMEVLIRFQGKKRFLQRLGYECLDSLEEFLNEIQQFESKQIPSLASVLEHFHRQSLEIKRDFEQGDARQELRIMTVHGAKGLQAPIVILPDTTGLPLQGDPFLTAEKGQILWSPPSSKETPLTKRLKEKAYQKRLQEYWRLLYVALTRAEDHLYLTGWEGPKKNQEKTWYSVLETCLKDLGTPLQNGGYVYETHTSCSSAVHCPLSPSLESSFFPLPLWLQHPVRPEQSLVWKNPSQMEEPPPLLSLSPSLFSSAYAKQRGTLIHQALEKISPFRGEKEKRLYLLLDQAIPSLSSDQKEEISAHVLKILGNPLFQSFLGPRSFAEVQVMGEVDGTLVSGQIDRLIEKETDVLILDYKTHAHPSCVSEEEISQYRSQMGLYKKLLTPLYPSRPLVSALFWTDSLELMVLS